MDAITLVGRRFGRLLVTGITTDTLLIQCACDCGVIRAMNKYSVSSGRAASCGCFRREHSSVMWRKHGKAESVEFATWLKIRNRCNNTRDISYKNYGGRGITVCERWEHSFENFYADMGDRQSNQYSIDRIDNNGNYEPSNCKWATRSEQAKNRRQKHYEHAGKKLTLLEWSAKTGIARGVMYSRIRLGWPIARVISEPTGTKSPQNTAKLYKYKWKQLTLLQWARLLSIPIGSLKSRIRAGWSITRALSTPV